MQIAIMLLLVAGLAHAQPSTTLEFKGQALGSNVADFRSRFPDFECTNPSKKVIGDTACWLSPETSCGDGYSARAIECRKSMEGKVTYGGLRVKRITAYFYDGIGLGYISIKIPSAQFESLLVLLVEKYGKPDTFSTETVRNRMGAEFENASAHWKTGILAEKYAKTLDEGLISLKLPAYSAEFNRRAADQKTINKSDL